MLSTWIICACKNGISFFIKRTKESDKFVIFHICHQNDPSLNVFTHLRLFYCPSIAYFYMQPLENFKEIFLLFFCAPSPSSIFRLPEWLNQMAQTISLLSLPLLSPPPSPLLFSMQTRVCCFLFFCCSILPTGKNGEIL